MRVEYDESRVFDMSVNWGSHADPRGILKDGAIYEVVETEVHSSYTRYFLEGFVDTSFNSVWFKELAPDPIHESRMDEAREVVENLKAEQKP